MLFTIVDTDITDIKADVIVNASNGIGYMGGKRGITVKLKGVAESINFKTKGATEKEAQTVAKKNKYLPISLCGHKAGEIFVTGAGCLDAQYIIHAVTMRYPAGSTNMNIIKSLLPKITAKAHELNARTLAIPLLGTGTGRLAKDKVLTLFVDYFNDISDMNIIITIGA